MTVPVFRGMPAIALATVFGCADLQAATLAVFDFDGTSGFDPAPDLLANGLLDAAFTDDAGTLTDFAGAPGRAIAASAFTLGNRIVLTVTSAPAQTIALEHLAFDLRVSSSGPSAWSLTVDDTLLASGPTTTTFAAVTVDLPTPIVGAPLVLALGGDGASSVRGTLRLDNVVLHGHLASVALPATLPLAAGALVLGALAATGRRQRPQAPGHAHSRHASSSGK